MRDNIKSGSSGGTADPPNILETSIEVAKGGGPECRFSQTVKSLSRAAVLRAAAATAVRRPRRHARAACRTGRRSARAGGRLHGDSGRMSSGEPTVAVGNDAILTRYNFESQHDLPSPHQPFGTVDAGSASRLRAVSSSSSVNNGLHGSWTMSASIGRFRSPVAAIPRSRRAHVGRCQEAMRGRNSQ